MTEDHAVWHKDIYRIIPLPEALGGGRRYLIACDIERHEDDQVVRSWYEKPEAVGGLPHDQAIIESIQFGRDIIDGKYPDLSPPQKEGAGLSP